MAPQALLYTVALSGALFFFGDKASACSCVGPPRADKEIAELIGSSDVVLLGRLDEGNVRIWAPKDEVIRSIHVTISPVEWFKGERQHPRVEIAIAAQSCLAEFVPGSVVLIFASEVGEGKRPTAHSCRMYIYELARPEYASENADLRARLAPVLEVLRSRLW